MCVTRGFMRPSKKLSSAIIIIFIIVSVSSPPSIFATVLIPSTLSYQYDYLFEPLPSIPSSPSFSHSFSFAFVDSPVFMLVFAVFFVTVTVFILVSVSVFVIRLRPRLRRPSSSCSLLTSPYSSIRPHVRYYRHHSSSSPCSSIVIVPLPFPLN